jgi:hypothetical protein
VPAHSRSRHDGNYHTEHKGHKEQIENEYSFRFFVYFVVNKSPLAKTPFRLLLCRGKSLSFRPPRPLHQVNYSKNGKAYEVHPETLLMGNTKQTGDRIWPHQYEGGSQQQG